MAISHKRSVLWLGVFAIGAAVSLTFIATSAKKPDAAAGQKPLPRVTITTAQRRDMPVSLLAQGHLVPLDQVDIRPQVTGTIRSVHFHEGDAVQAGQLLFTLDASEADAQLRHAQAQMAQVRAQLDDARRDQERSGELLKQGFISAGAVATAGSKTASLQAQLGASRADIDSAKVAVDHTRIVAPISGRAGALAVHPGSLAQVNTAAPLVTLVQLNPIAVEFSLPEKDLNQILTTRARSAVHVTLDAPDGTPVEGTLSFVNNTVSADTGTIALKATFSNPEAKLWPGEFCRVTVAAGVQANAVVLPPQAILEGPQGRFVYLIDAQNKVVAKAVTLSRIQDRMAIVGGLSAGEKVILEGNQNLRAGAQVQVVQDVVPSAAGATP